jgi:AcrR family transcriptional regulator
LKPRKLSRQAGGRNGGGRSKGARQAGAADGLNFDTVDANSIVKTQVSDARLVSERRSHLIATAIDLFSDKGYHATTVKELAEVAEVSPGLIYQYFEDKEDILFMSLQVVVHSISRVIPAAMEEVDHPVAKFAVAFTQYCRIVDQNRRAVELTYRETKSLRRVYRDALKDMEIETNAIIKQSLEECIRRGLMRPISTDLFVYQVIITAQTWALKHWRLSKITDIDEYIRANLDFLLTAALTRKGWNSYRRNLGAPGPDAAPPRT